MKYYYAIVAAATALVLEACAFSVSPNCGTVPPRILSTTSLNAAEYEVKEGEGKINLMVRIYIYIYIY